MEFFIWQVKDFFVTIPLHMMWSGWDLCLLTAWVTWLFIKTNFCWQDMIPLTGQWVFMRLTLMTSQPVNFICQHLLFLACSLILSHVAKADILGCPVMATVALTLWRSISTTKPLQAMQCKYPWTYLTRQAGQKRE